MALCILLILKVIYAFIRYYYVKISEHRRGNLEFLLKLDDKAQLSSALTGSGPRTQAAGHPKPR